MATKKKATKKKQAPAAKVSWADTMKKALEKKTPAGGFPDQGKPRDSKVKQLKRTVY
jgi:hypothetical protein